MQCNLKDCYKFIWLVDILSGFWLDSAFGRSFENTTKRTLLYSRRVCFYLIEIKLIQNKNRLEDEENRPGHKYWKEDARRNTRLWQTSSRGRLVLGEDERGVLWLPGRVVYDRQKI